MTRKQVSVLDKCARSAEENRGTFAGLNANYGHQAGYARQITWLLKERMVRRKGGFLIATIYGRKMLAYQKSA